jgi:2-oxoglutarate dehydrogenase E1 component
VKYHAGASRSLNGNNPVDLVVIMPPNPSHLEHVNPIIVGMARAAGTTADKPGRPYFDPRAILPVVIHGDAAFPGQGIVPRRSIYSAYGAIASAERSTS